MMRFLSTVVRAKIERKDSVWRGVGRGCKDGRESRMEGRDAIEEGSRKGHERGR